ncbi:MAG: GNAT family N-acetyltransferase, partial [Chloroflexota bacterium]
RPFDVESDLPRLVRFLSVTESIDQSGEDISEETLRAQLTVPRHTPALDRWVIEHPDHQDDLIGHSAIWAASTADGVQVAEVSIVIHPEWRRRGLGTELLERSTARVQTLGAMLMRLYADTRDHATTTFLTKHHFQSASAYTEMGAASDTITETVSLPDGYTIRSYSDVQQVQALVDGFNKGFAGLWGHHTVTEADVTQALPSLTWDGVFLLFAPDNKIAGICCAHCHAQRTKHNGQPTGYVDSPGVVPAHRSESLYQALLLHAVQWLHTQHQTRVELESWGDTAETIQSYEQLGFIIIRQQLAYQRELTIE